MGCHGIPRGFSLGGFAPQTPHQGGSAPLDPPKYGQVTPQDGLVTPPPYGDYVRTSLKNVRNSWKMILFHDFSIRALKLAANHEKQVFTFFAFLPPYMAVSGSAVPRKR